jgi:hypothetical protein
MQGMMGMGTGRSASSEISRLTGIIHSRGCVIIASDVRFITCYWLHCILEKCMSLGLYLFDLFARNINGKITHLRALTREG